MCMCLIGVSMESGINLIRRVNSLSSSLTKCVSLPHPRLVPCFYSTLIGREWRAKFPSATVYAETRSTDKHHTLAQEGFTPVLRSSRFDGMRCPSVVFCAAPSGEHFASSADDGDKQPQDFECL